MGEAMDGGAVRWRRRGAQGCAGWVLAAALAFAPAAAGTALAQTSAPAPSSTDAAMAPAGPPDYAGYDGAAFLGFLDARETGLSAPPRIGLSFGGRTLRAVLDSGSTGIVVAARLLPDIDRLPVQAPGRVTYTSSGRVMLGRWVVTPVTLSGADGASVTTDPMPVLAVQEVRCLHAARDCTPNADPRDIAMVGIGYGREKDAQAQGTPEKNPLLRLAADGRRWRRGYILTARGVQAGLTASSTRGFALVKLARQADGVDWAGTPACLSVERRTPPACGTLLVDTGVGAMFLTLPAAQAGGAVDSEGRPTLPDGTEIAVRVEPAVNPSAVGAGGARGFDLYSFAVGGPSPVAPHGVHLHVAPDRVFVNTSFHLLNGFDVLYDAEGGTAGFRPREP